jgi:hypothetical protein
MARALALAGATVVVAAGCASDGPSGPQGIVQASADKTADAGGTKVTMTGSISGSSSDTSELSAEGEFDGEQGRMTLTVTDDGRTEKTDLAFDGTVYYVRLPPAGSAGLPEGKEWLRVDVAEFSPGGPDEDLSTFLQFAQTNPANALGFLRGASDDMEEVGTEDVDGAETTHYRGTADLEVVADEAGDLGPVYEQLLETSEFTEIPIDVWIDDDGRVRRLVYELPVPEARGGGTATITLEFADFGADVDVTPPSEDESFDLGTFTGEDQ